MNDDEIIPIQKVMTIKEIADILKLSERTIQIKAKELFPEKIKERQTSYFTSSEVTKIKLACEKKFADIKTDEEMQNQTIEVIQYWISK